MNLYAINERETLAALHVHLSARTYHGHTIEQMFEQIPQHPAAILQSAVEEATQQERATCRHCARTIINDAGRWVDPWATGDDSVWRETCPDHDTFTAEHEPEGE